MNIVLEKEVVAALVFEARTRRLIKRSQMLVSQMEQSIEERT
jgi:hypothetical protein